jgi:hypothetical protein
MGLTTWKGQRGVTKIDVTVAKNYLAQGEIADLNRLTGMVLDYFEDQAERRQPVTMAALEEKLNEFLKFNDRPVLTHLGSVSREAADVHAVAEYEKFTAARRLRRQEEGAASVVALKKVGKEISKRGRRKSA